MANMSIIQLGSKPKLPQLLSIPTVALLMPSVLFLINFPTPVNYVLVAALVVLVLLDRLAMRREAIAQYLIQDAALKQYLAAADKATPSSKPEADPDNSDKGAE